METPTQLKSVIFTMDIFAVQYGIGCITSVARRCVCTLFFSSFGDLVSKKKSFKVLKLPGKKYLSPFVGTKETFLRKLPSQG